MSTKIDKKFIKPYYDLQQTHPNTHMLPISKNNKNYAIVLCMSSSPIPPSRGHYCVPAHMVLMNPYKDPLSFGPEICKTATGTHVGLNSQPDPVAGILIGNEFLVLSECSFVILTPKEERNKAISLFDALLPTSKTHLVNFGKKGKVYKISTGSVILAQIASNNNFSSATVFLEDCDHYNRSVETLQWSLAHFNHAHARLVLKHAKTNNPFLSNDRVTITEEWGIPPPVNSNSKR